MEYNAYQNIYNGEPLTKRTGAEFIHRLREAQVTGSICGFVCYDFRRGSRQRRGSNSYASVLRRFAR